MNLRYLTLIVALGCTPVLCQDAASSAASAEDLGFTYHVPSGWFVVDTRASLPEVKQRQLANAKTDEEKKEIACIQIPISARRTDPPSYLVVAGMPFTCIGQILTEKDLPGFAEGSSEGPRMAFDFGEPEIGSYSLGNHHMWIERAKGSPKGHPEMPYTLEISCGLLKKAAVCWMAVTGNEQALKQFEGNAVTLDGDFFPEFAPANAFDKKPGP